MMQQKEIRQVITNISELCAIRVRGMNDHTGQASDKATWITNADREEVDRKGMKPSTRCDQ